MSDSRPGTKPGGGDHRSPLANSILTALALIGTLILIWLLIRLKPVIIIILISVVLATGLGPMVERLRKSRIWRGRRIPRSVGILIAYIIAILVLAGAATMVLVPVIRESIKFSRNLPRYIEATKGWLADIHQRYPNVPDYAGLLDRARDQLDEAAGYILSSVGAAFGVFGGIITVVSVLVITFYLLVGYEGIRDGFLSLLPKSRRAGAGRTLTRVAAAMGGWLRGQLLLAAIIGVATALGMWALGVPYPFVIAVVGAVGELVPMLGPFVAAVPAVLITLLVGSTWKLIACVVFFAILAQVENNYLAPRVMQSQVGLSPVVTILALLAGATLFGLVGALLAVPIAAGLQVVFVDVIAPAIRKSNGERETGE